MTTRQTSMDAYINLIESGVLAEKNKIVYKHLFHGGATTQKNTERLFNDTTYTLRPRFSQLEKMGLIKAVGYEACIETGKKNMLWDVTDRIHPLDLKLTTNTKKNRVDKALSSFRELYINKTTSTINDWKEVADLIKEI